MQNKRTIGILGSTGSIGKSACQLLTTTLKDNFSVEFLSCHSNFEELSLQIHTLQPKAVCVSDVIFKKTKEAFPNIIVYESHHDMLAEHNTDVTLHAISGIAGIECVLDSIAGTNILALANKESIVSAWNFIQESSIEHGTQIIPVDSEHNSLYRILEIIDPNSVLKIGITASGGAFFGQKFHTLHNVSPEYVINNHPVWKMGIKNSIDSATMANKVLELIEAMQLFSCEESGIDVTINRQSIVHANVWLKSGGVLSLSSKPDMKLHIAHSVMFPDYSAEFENPFENIQLDFHTIKKEEFPIFFLGKDIAKTNDAMKFTAFNVANEVAVEKFCCHKIKYTDILPSIESAIDQLNYTNPSSIEDLIHTIKEMKRRLT